LRADIKKVHGHLQETVSIERFQNSAVRLRALEEQVGSIQLEIDDYEETFPDLYPLEEFLDTFYS
jgi:hypothetical protein